MAADGRGKSLWAPREEGQKIAMRRAYPEGLLPTDVQYIEAHATSTQVGDVTELKALAGAFPDRGKLPKRIPLGSVKANIGHTLETAGVASLLKAVLAMRRDHPPMPISRPELGHRLGCLAFLFPAPSRAWNRPDECLGGPP